MEYMQLTLDDYIQCKNEIKKDLGGIVKSFVRIGWQLTRINNSQAYKNDGYSTIAEFAKAEYGMNPSGVSRFMSVYERYSVCGDTPELKEQYRDFNFSQLTEMLQLSEDDQAMILPEAKREDIRALNQFNKENANNPDTLLNWQQEEEDSLRKSILEFFRERKDSLNALYESEAYRENDVEEMKAIVRRGKMTFKKPGIFIIMYNEKLFVKNKVESRCDVEWEEFFLVTRSIFDSVAAGGHTWENYFEPECQNSALEENDFQNEVHTEEPRVENEPKNENQKHSEKEKSQETAVALPESKVTLLKPDENQREYLNAFAKYFIKCKRDWFRDDYSTRVLNVIESPKAIREMLGPNGRHWYFGIHGGTASINLFDDYVQIWTEQHVCLGDFEWFYLAAAIQSMWNVVAEEEAQIPGQKKIEDYPEVMPEIAPAQTKCIHRPEFFCTLPEAAKLAAGDGIDCNRKCCWNCENHGLCGYECNSSTHRPEPEENAQEIKVTQGDAAQRQLEESERCKNAVPEWDLPFIKAFLSAEAEGLDEYLQHIDNLPRNLILKKQALVEGLKLLVERLEFEDEKPKELIQPPLPIMKNNDQRKAWLRTWKEWGLWYQDEHTGAKYYKYDFENGARLIAEVYTTPKDRNIPEFESCYFHLIGGPEPPKGTYGIPKWNTYKTYNRYPNNDTELVEFLKEVQKNGKV